MLFSEYKRVDNICNDMFSGRGGISQYIAEMEKVPSYSHSIVPSWDTDYRSLKHIRWLRNQIAHSSTATDCNENDVEWLEDFHNRLLERQDPLALLEKKERSRQSLPPQRETRQKPDLEPYADWSLPSPSREKGDFSSNNAAIIRVLISAVLLGLAFAAGFLFFSR